MTAPPRERPRLRAAEALDELQREAYLAGLAAGLHVAESVLIQSHPLPQRASGVARRAAMEALLGAERERGPERAERWLAEERR